MFVITSKKQAIPSPLAFEADFQLLDTVLALVELADDSEP